MTHFNIREEIYNGGNPAVGLNIKRLEGPTTFNITRVSKKTGKRAWPYTFAVPTPVVLACPRKPTKYGGVVLAIVPLNKCTEAVPNV